MINLLQLQKNEDYGIALIFDIEKLEKFDDRYSDSHLKEDNVKIEAQIKDRKR